MHESQRRRERRVSDIVVNGRFVFFAVATLWVADSARAFSQTPSQAPQADRVLLGDLYSQAQRANPRVAAARSLSVATAARVSGATRPPDPQLQFGFMNYTVPGLAPMPTLE